jgi:hypothetical protein
MSRRIFIGDKFLDVETLSDDRVVRVKRKAGGVSFVMFPKALWEALAAHKAGVSAYRVSLFLLHEALKSRNFRTGPAVVVLSNVALAKWGVDRDGKRAALKVLRKLIGLFGVDETQRASPRITVLCAD